MFCEFISQLFASFLPVDSELNSSNAVIYPLEPHIHCFTSALFSCVIGNLSSGRVVVDYGGGSLRMAHCVECSSDGTGLYAVVERTALTPAPLHLFEVYELKQN